MSILYVIRGRDSGENGEARGTAYSTAKRGTYVFLEHALQLYASQKVIAAAIVVAFPIGLSR